jgi:putative flippase GtrA
LLFTNVRQLARSNRKEVKRFVKFALVGAAGSITDFAVLNLLVQLAGLPLAVANTCSFIAAVAQNFALNRVWTFPESRERHASGQLAQFAMVSLVGYGINQLVFLTLHHLWESYWMAYLGADSGFLVSYNVAKLFAIGVVLFWNFTANRLWTYRGL